VFAREIGRFEQQLSQLLFVPPGAQAFVLDAEFGVIALQTVPGNMA